MGDGRYLPGMFERTRSIGLHLRGKSPFLPATIFASAGCHTRDDLAPPRPGNCRKDRLITCFFLRSFCHKRRVDLSRVIHTTPLLTPPPLARRTDRRSQACVTSSLPPWNRPFSLSTSRAFQYISRPPYTPALGCRLSLETIVKINIRDQNTFPPKPLTILDVERMRSN